MKVKRSTITDEINNPAIESTTDNNITKNDKEELVCPESKRVKVATEEYSALWASHCALEALLSASNTQLEARQSDVLTLLRENQEQRDAYESQINTMTRTIERLLDINEKQAKSTVTSRTKSSSSLQKRCSKTYILNLDNQ